MSEPALQVFYPQGDDIKASLPSPDRTRVSADWIKLVIDGAIARLNECHQSGLAPINSRTVALVWDYAFARALKQHHVSEAFVDTPAADAQIEQANAAIEGYCAAVTARELAEEPGGVGGEVPAAHFESTPF